VATIVETAAVRASSPPSRGGPRGGPALRRLSLRARTFLAASLGAAGLLAADGAVSIRAALRDGRAALEERADLLATIQAGALAVSMWDLDDAKIEAGIAALALDPDFRAARLHAADGSLVAERGKPGARPLRGPHGQPGGRLPGRRGRAAGAGRHRARTLDGPALRRAPARGRVPSRRRRGPGRRGAGRGLRRVPSGDAAARPDGAGHGATRRRRPRRRRARARARRRGRRGGAGHPGLQRRTPWPWPGPRKATARSTRTRRSASTAPPPTAASCPRTRPSCA
jgi:hypothetical protein